MKPFIGTLRVTNPVRQSWTSSRKRASLEGGARFPSCSFVSECRVWFHRLHQGPNPPWTAGRRSKRPDQHVPRQRPKAAGVALGALALDGAQANIRTLLTGGEPSRTIVNSVFTNLAGDEYAGATVDFLAHAGGSIYAAGRLPSLPGSIRFATLTHELKGGGSYLLTAEQFEEFVQGRTLIGRLDGQFMTSARRMNNLIYERGGDPVLLGKKLGVNKWKQETDLIRIDVLDPLSFNPRLPESSMGGANSLFRQGGVTSGGVLELVTDQLPSQNVWATPLTRP